MKRLEKEQTRTITNTITVFVAEDGTEFSTEEQCRKYEESAMFALKVRIKDKMKLIEDEFCNGLDELLDDGCRRSDYYYVRLQTEQDVKDFIAYIKSTGYWVPNNSNSKPIPYTVAYLKYEELKPDETYIFRLCPECEYCEIVSKESFLKAFENSYAVFIAGANKE